MIFNNKFIRDKGTCIFYDHMYRRGVYKLKHILENNGELKSDRHFVNSGLDANEIAIIRKIYESLPLSWKRNMTGEHRNAKETDFILGGTITAISNISSKQIYLQFLKSEGNMPVVIDRLRIQYEFSCKEIENIYLRLRQCTLNSRLREFQFKLLHGIIYTNHHLFRFRFVSDNLCSFCRKEEETYQHIFYTCEYAQTIWERCRGIIDYVDLRNICWKDIMFGMQESNRGMDQLLNHILILVKYLIFMCRERKTPPTYIEIKNKIMEDKLEEHKLASIRNTLSIHLNKWENLKL